MWNCLRAAPGKPSPGRPGGICVWRLGGGDLGRRRVPGPVPTHFAGGGGGEGRAQHTDGAEAREVERFLLPTPAHLDRWRTSQQAGRRLAVALLPAPPSLVSSPPELIF